MSLFRPNSSVATNICKTKQTQLTSTKADLTCELKQSFFSEKKNRNLSNLCHSSLNSSPANTVDVNLALSAHMDSIQVSCNWKIINDKQLQNAVTVVESPASIDLDDLVTLDSCIALSQGDITDLLEVSIDVSNQNLCIQDIYVVSEARILELYGKSGQYDSTINAVNTEDGDEDMQVFKAKLTLKEASTNCSIKFAGILNDKKEMWLLGCGVILKKVVASEVNNSLVERAEKFLQESRVPLSEGAKNCRKKLILKQQDVKMAPTLSIESEIKKYVDKVCSEFEVNLKNHIDMKFQALEDLMNRRLDQVLASVKN